MSEERDYGLLYRILDISQVEAVEIASRNTGAKQRHERYRHDIAGFIRYYFPEYITLEPAAWQKAVFSILQQPVRNKRNGRWTWHVDEGQAHELASFHRASFRHIPKPVDVLRAIAMCAPREQGKSTVFARLVLVWMLVYGHVRFVAYFRGNGELADSFLADTMVEFTDNERLLKDYGNLKGSVWKEGMYSLKTGAVVISLGRGANVRGLVSRSRRPDLIILDDLISDADKESPGVMSKTYDWIFSAITGLGKDALIIYLNTIYNEMDPMSRILQRIEQGDLPGWLGLRLSAEIDDGTPLWPEYWPMEDLARKKAEVGSLIYNIEYMSVIMDGVDRILPASIFSWIPRSQVWLPDYDIHFAIDPNAEGGDDAAICVVGRSYSTGRYLTLDQWDRDHATITELVDKLVAWNAKYEPSMIAWEQVGFQKVYQKLLQEILMPQGVALPLVGVDVKGSKEQRAVAIAPFLENGSWLHCEDLKDNSSMYKIHCFPMKGMNDGPVDAMSLAWASFNRGLGRPVGHAGRRRSDLPGLIGRYTHGW